MSARVGILAGLRAGDATPEQVLDAYKAEVLREAAEELRVSLARTVVGQAGHLDIVVSRLVDMADQVEMGGAR